MPGRPSHAGQLAAEWLRAGKGTPAQAARLFGLSASQARRIAVQIGVPSQPAGRPPSQ